MAEAKTKPTTVDVRAYIAGLQSEKRKKDASESIKSEKYVCASIS